MISTSAGARVRFVPNQTFAYGLTLRNTSRVPVVVTDARVLEPPRTLIHQTGARFNTYTPTRCSRRFPCDPPLVPILSASGFAHDARPVTLAPGMFVGIELDFRLGSCAEVPGASSAPITRLRVTFRRAGGPAQHQVFGLYSPPGPGVLSLRMPRAADCA